MRTDGSAKMHGCQCINRRVWRSDPTGSTTAKAAIALRYSFTNSTITNHLKLQRSRRPILEETFAPIRFSVSLLASDIKRYACRGNTAFHGFIISNLTEADHTEVPSLHSKRSTMPTMLPANDFLPSKSLHKRIKNIINLPKDDGSLQVEIIKRNYSPQSCFYRWPFSARPLREGPKP